MGKDKYIAYVGSYTHGKAKGITVCDVDLEKGELYPKYEVPVGNPSYMRIANNKNFLYSVSDLGISSFKIDDNGDIELVNLGSINGMRACHISVDKADKYIFTAGYHDGKVSVVRINEDGSVGELTDEVFHKGMGSIAERTFRPHVTCARLTPDEKFLCVCDNGIDQVKIYKFNHETGKISLAEILRTPLESAPRHILFSPDGKFAYVITQLRNVVLVYEYDSNGGTPNFKFVGEYSSLGKKHNDKSALAAIKLTKDGKHVFCSNAGDNSIAFFDRNEEDGTLTQRCVLPISGDYPKQISLFPDEQHIASLNHESGEVTFFKIDYEKGLIVMHGKPIRVETPNCAVFKKIN